jgi:hypothetical protein
MGVCLADVLHGVDVWGHHDCVPILGSAWMGGVAVVFVAVDETDQGGTVWLLADTDRATLETLRAGEADLRPVFADAEVRWVARHALGGLLIERAGDVDDDWLPLEGARLVPPAGRHEFT